VLRNFRLLLVVVIVAGLAAGAAFGAGAVYGRTLGAKPATATSPGSSTPQASTGGFSGANSSAAALAADGGARGGVRGNVESIEGDVLTIKGTDGTVSKVKIDPKTPIRKTVDGTREDLQSGASVLISVDRGVDGTVSASQVSIVPAGGAVPGTGGTPTGRPTVAAGASPAPGSTPGTAGGGRRGDPNATPAAGR
jgi:hypothetical protein